MRATSRAVRAARRIQRPTPAAQLSGFFVDFRLMVMVRAPAISVWIRNSHILPMIRQGLIHVEEIGPSTFESPDHIGSRDIVAPLPYSARDPTQRQRRRSESNVVYFDQITGCEIIRLPFYFDLDFHLGI
jgi:hypothetical protein